MKVNFILKLSFSAKIQDWYQIRFICMLFVGYLYSICADLAQMLHRYCTDNAQIA